MRVKPHEIKTINSLSRLDKIEKRMLYELDRIHAYADLREQRIIDGINIRNNILKRITKRRRVLLGRKGIAQALARLNNNDLVNGG